MPHAFPEESALMMEALDEAAAKISAINNPEMMLARNRILTDIRKHSNILKAQSGIDIIVPGEQPLQKPKPLTKLFGKDIVFKPKTPIPSNIRVNDTAAGKEKLKSLTPNSRDQYEVEVAELRDKVNTLWPKFLIASPDELLDSISELEMRAVAKQAGLPFTDNHPKKIDVMIVQQIKDAIIKMNAAQPSATITNDDQKFRDIKEAAHKLYKALAENSIENKEVLENFADIEIRAVAKMAGLPFTEKEPPKIAVKTIDHIRNAIKKKIEIENAGK